MQGFANLGKSIIHTAFYSNLSKSQVRCFPQFWAKPSFGISRKWIRHRIDKYGFEENQDFSLVSVKSETKGRGGDRRSKDYLKLNSFLPKLGESSGHQRAQNCARYQTIALKLHSVDRWITPFIIRGFAAQVTERDR